jgi:hypothetical protein
VLENLMPHKMCQIQTCKYCTDYKGRPKPILPEDMPAAIRMPDGSYKCEPCQIEEIQNRIVKVTPNSESAKRILAERAAKQKKDLEFKNWEAKIRNMPGERYSFRHGAGLQGYHSELTNAQRNKIAWAKGEGNHPSFRNRKQQYDITEKLLRLNGYGTLGG